MLGLKDVFLVEKEVIKIKEGFLIEREKLNKKESFKGFKKIIKFKS